MLARASPQSDATVRATNDDACAVRFAPRGSAPLRRPASATSGSAAAGGRLARHEGVHRCAVARVALRVPFGAPGCLPLTAKRGAYASSALARSLARSLACLLQARAAAGAMGYLCDPYAPRLLSGSSKAAARRALARRRPPLINRGTHARAMAVQRTLDAFLAATASDMSRQIVSLGAGYSSSALLLAQQRGGRPPRGLRFFELDFHEVCAAKAATVAADQEMMRLLGGAEGGEPDKIAEGVTDNRLAASGVELDANACTLRTPAYCLFPCDLRDAVALREGLAAEGFDDAAPTLVLCECVLSYLDPVAGDALLEWAARLPQGAVAAYEAVGMEDAFGQQMAQHLADRGCAMRGAAAGATLAAHEKRCEAAGFEHAQAVDMYTLYTCSPSLDRAEIARAARIEPLDEIEEWRMLMQHYCFLVGSQQGLKEALWLTPGDEGAAAFPQGTPGMLLPGVPRPRGLPCAD